MAKTFLCLGAGPGIGLSAAIKFAKENYEAILVSRNTKRLEALTEEFRARTGKNVRTLAADVGNAEQMEALAKKLPPIDVALFNAAIIHAQTLEEADYATLKNDIQTGITGALYALKTFAPAMLQRESGAFLLTGGMLANAPLPHYPTLGIAKAGIKNMTQALFEAFRKKNVHIASVTVCAAIAPNSREAEDVAELYWNLCSQPVSEWTWELEYRADS